MKISKTKFTNFLRCRNYCALNEIHEKKEKAIVALDELEEIMSYENNEKKKLIFSDMFDDDQEDITVKKLDKQTETLMPYYNKIEELSANKIKKQFGGNIIYSQNTFKQKYIQTNIDGYDYFCFLDGFQEDDKYIRIIESKATTSKKFQDLSYVLEEGPKANVFQLSPDGILIFNEEFLKEENKRDKLFDRFSDIGRYIYDLAYQRKIFELGTKTSKEVKYYLGVLNCDYIYDGNVDDNNIPIYDEDIIKLIDLTALTKEYMKILDHDIALVNSYLDEMDANPDHIKIGKYCQRKDLKECNFYPYCSKRIKKVPEKNSIFTYLGSHFGFNGNERYEMINDGLVNMVDVPDEWLVRRNNVIQKEVVLSKKIYIDKEKIKKGIEALRFPLYHLDFESFPCPLPRLKGEKPYTQSLFQFSIHVEETPFSCDKEKDNYSFLAKNDSDPRRELVEKMIEIIKPDSGHVIVYNQSFEKTRIKELAILYPEYKERLEDINDRIFDLMHLLRGNKKFFSNLGFSEEDSIIKYYHEDLNGSYSIKKVLPIFTDLTYQGMAVGNGTEALATYANFPLMDQETFNKAYNDLLEYCKQDTWAMVEILWGLRRMVL
ncbi:DUF2779 domain-containing protein [Acholeplasma sp. OttesenSCG-928-E16]|nr:DUF2779 domain-containing protein [Acholeplasma sp. OttesenSCG-928-E16]